MHTESSLLAHLVPRLTRNVEDAATDALAFILNKSEECRGALEKLLSDQSGEQGFALGPLTRFRTQVNFEGVEGKLRPDMIGYDRSGAVRLVEESKFGARLLKGQASGFIDQLEEPGPGCLLFIAPGTRITTLWAEIECELTTDLKPVLLELIETGDRMRRAAIKYARTRVPPVDTADEQVSSDAEAAEYTEKRVILISWDLLLDCLAKAAPAADSQTASNIGQLRGLTDEQDLCAFKPIRKAELDPSFGRQMCWFNQLVDDMIAHGRREGWLSTEGLRQTQSRNGYGHYFRFLDDSKAVEHHEHCLCVSLRHWAKHGDTPLWLKIDSRAEAVHNLGGSDPALTVFKGGSGSAWTPIRLTTGVGYHRVLDDASAQMHKISKILAK